MEPETSIPEVKIERRPSDFRYSLQLPLLQTGTCCTSCCCLHWIGAATGGIIGLVKASSSFKGRVDSRVRLATYTAFWITAGAFTVLIGVVIALASNSSPLIGAQFVEPFLGGLAFVPSLFFIPSGLLSIVIAARHQWSRKKESPSQETDTVEVPLQDPIDFACRVAWMSFWFSTLGGAIGYGIIFLIAAVLS